jgi:ribonuclease J
MLVQHARLAQRTGISSDEVCVVENGDVMQFTKQGVTRAGRTYGGPVFVDGLGVGDVSQVVLRDRRHLSEDGMIVVTFTIDASDGKILAGPDIISRGFTYDAVRDNEGVIDEVRHRATEIIEDGAKRGLTEWTAIREHVHKGLQKFVFDRTKRRPMIVPVVMEV